MARVHHVEKCRKSPGKCGRCGATIKKGEAYKWAQPGFRGRKVLRCALHGFKASELTNNDRLSRVLAAQENAQDEVATWDGEDLDTLKGYLETCADEAEEVAEEYRASAEAVENGLDSMKADCEEKADSLESWAEELRGALDSIDDRPEIEEAEEEEGKERTGEDGKTYVDPAKEGVTQEDLDAWIEEARNAASNELDGCPL